MKNKTLICYLCYVTNENKSRRMKNFKKSLDSLKHLDKKNCQIIALNNNCCNEAVDLIKSNRYIDEVITFENNFWDVSVIFSAAYLANKKEFKYSCYMYDDFVVYDNNFLKPCMEFLNANEDVGCVRITKYEYDKMNSYDSNIVPKSVNPESVRHYSNNHVKSAPLTWEGPYNIYNRKFYKNNWHYSSRPALWRNDILYSFFDHLEDIPVMQPFEKFAAIKFFNTGLKTGVLDIGSVHTFLESERTTVSGGMGYNVNISKSLIKKELDKSGKNNETKR